MDVSTTTAPQVHCPETDGKPIAETDIHIDALISLLQEGEYQRLLAGGAVAG